jgi:putative glycosyltransferase (TIGR04372 family)
MPLVLLVRIIRPFVWIRFGSIRSDVIGHFVMDSEYYLCEKEIEIPKSIDFFYFSFTPQANEQWALMARRHLRIHPVIRYFDRVNHLLPGGQLHHKRAGHRGSLDFKGFLHRTKPHMSFTVEEHNIAKRFFEEIGFKSGELYVCLVVRDSAYKEKHQNVNGDRDWSYHNYRDSEIDTYEQAALALANKGYWVFRMGKVVHKPFGLKHSHVIDYANSAVRNDLLDIYLMANCYFCISVGTGLDSVADVFRKPAVYVNYLPIYYMVTWANSITVPKHLKWFNGDPLTLREHLDHCYSQSKHYKEAKIEIIDLSPKEIEEAVMEMEGKLSGKWVDTPENIKNQKQFQDRLKSTFGNKNQHRFIHSEVRIGSCFVNSNQDWLN